MISPLCCGDTYISDDIFCSRVTSGVTASIRRAVGVDVLKVDLLPKEVVSAHCEAEERGRPRTSRLGRGGQEDEEEESNKMIISCGAKVKRHLSTCRLNIEDDLRSRLVDEIIMTFYFGLPIFSDRV